MMLSGPAVGRGEIGTVGVHPGRRVGIFRMMVASMVFQWGGRMGGLRQ